MPFSGYDLISRIHAVQATFQETQAAGNARMVTVFAPKGGVGTTTIALNLSSRSARPAGGRRSSTPASSSATCGRCSRSR